MGTPHVLVLARAPVVVHQDLGGQGRERREGAGAAPCALPGQLRGVAWQVRAGLAAVDRGIALRQELRLLSANESRRAAMADPDSGSYGRCLAVLLAPCVIGRFERRLR